MFRKQKGTVGKEEGDVGKDFFRRGEKRSIFGTKDGRMIYQVLTCIAEGLNGYLENAYEEAGGLARVGEIGGERGEQEMNRMVVALLNVEREGAMGIGGAYQAEGKGFLQKLPPWYLNMYFVVAAVFEGKRYGEGVRMLSDSVSYLQQHPVFVPVSGGKFMIEPVSLSLQELTNVWSILGGRYYPSVVCKVRMLRFEGDEVGRTVSRVGGR